MQDPWERVLQCIQNRSNVPDHGAEEDILLMGYPDNMVVSLRCVPTSKLRASVINVAVHHIRSGSPVKDSTLACPATRLRNAPRRDILKDVLSFIGNSEDESHTLAVAIEHALC